jgi:hypothetical protein
MWKTIGIGLLGHTRNPGHRWLPQGATVNNNTYCDTVAGLRRRIQQRRKGKCAKKVFLLHDNACPHSSKQTRAQLDDFGCTYDPPYSKMIETNSVIRKWWEELCS